MKQPWFTYRKIGGPIIRAYAWWWPNSWQGWLCSLGFAVLWIGGVNVITAFMFPERAKVGWIAIGLLAFVTLVLFNLILRATGEDAGRRFRDED
ncbi:MAG TPA: hypothetical protein VG867_10740 [Rhizomicrobium sp.]|nr:hypothetical protein [Rhizomicrobium sp.]